jgi:2-methylaconitate cis-trans-isomerase PrpF
MEAFTAALDVMVYRCMPKAEETRELAATLMRGGTSKSLVVEARLLPAPGPALDRVALEALGGPDPNQIDGVGGATPTTSKFTWVAPSPEAGVDVDYNVAVVGAAGEVDWSGTCGNITAAVGPFAIDAGLVEAREPVTVVHLRNVATGGLVRLNVPVAGGRAATEGAVRIAGVPRPGAPIACEYLEPGASVFAAVLPTGEERDPLPALGPEAAGSLVDVAHPYLFVRAADLGPRGHALTAEGLPLDLLERARIEAAERAGAAGEPGVPRLAIVAAATDAEADLEVLAISRGVPLPALPVTAALCLAAAAQLPGTVVAECAGAAGETLRMRHPGGVVEAGARRDADGAFAAATIVRTARRLMDGVVHLHTPIPLAPEAGR